MQQTAADEPSLYPSISFIFTQNDPTTHLAREGPVKVVVNNLVRLTAPHFTNAGLWDYVVRHYVFVQTCLDDTRAAS